MVEVAVCFLDPESVTERWGPESHGMSQTQFLVGFGSPDAQRVFEATYGAFINRVGVIVIIFVIVPWKRKEENCKIAGLIILKTLPVLDGVGVQLFLCI